MTTLVPSKITSLFDRIAFAGEQLSELVIDKQYNKISNTVFEATILTTKQEGIRNNTTADAAGNETANPKATQFLHFRVRPHQTAGVFTPSPYSTQSGDGLASASMRKNIILGSPIGSIAIHEGQQHVEPGPGQVWQCRYSTPDRRGIMLVKYLHEDPTYTENPDGTISDPSFGGNVVGNYDSGLPPGASTERRYGDDYIVTINPPPAGSIPGAYLPATTKITSPYGMRFHPVHKENRMHNGIDFSGGKRTSSGLDAKVMAVKPEHQEPCFACFEGTVTSINIKLGTPGDKLSGKGVMVIRCKPKDVDDKERTIDLYYIHVEKALVKVGDSVTKGQAVANIGSQGPSTGPHLHFGVKEGGKYVNPNLLFGWSIQEHVEDRWADRTPMDDNYFVDNPEVPQEDFLEQHYIAQNVATASAGSKVQAAIDTCWASYPSSEQATQREQCIQRYYQSDLYQEHYAEDWSVDKVNNQLPELTLDEIITTPDLTDPVISQYQSTSTRAMYSEGGILNLNSATEETCVYNALTGQFECN